MTELTINDNEPSVKVFKMATHVLMKRGKRELALYVKSECGRESDRQQICELLEHILNPSNPIDNFEAIDWCQWIIAGGMTYDEFSKTVRLYDSATTCGLVWTANFVAYRCRTCGISPCMSLCADCFQAGKHEGHDFNMFRSQAGGACDCGDVSVMNELGFCSRHGPHRREKVKAVPPDLLSVAQLMVPHLLLRLIQHMREHCLPDMIDTYLVAMQDSEQFLKFLHSLSDMGAAMRNVVTQALTNPRSYQSLTTDRRDRNEKEAHSRANYLKVVNSIDCPPVPEYMKGKPGFEEKLQHTTFLEELLFWIVKYEFPQHIVTWLLGMLPDDSYKMEFTKAFVRHYSRMTSALVNSIDRNSISNKVVHVSVQLFSNEAFAFKMVEEYNLLYIMVTSLDYMIRGIITQSEMQDSEHNFHVVVDCSKEILKDRCYWPIVSDLINVLSHRSVAYKFLNDRRLLEQWFELLTYFQGMNLNQRELEQHVEYEPDTYYNAYAAELEISASPVWSLVSQCSGENAKLLQLAKQRLLNALQDWFDAINIKSGSEPNPYQITFHLPLHRYLATFLRQIILGLNITRLVDVLPKDEVMTCLMVHPLQCQVAFTEVFNGMWVRNGIQVKGQAMTYIQCHFCNSLVDQDLYLLQLCACRLCPDFMVRFIIERYHVMDWMTMAPIHDNSFLEPEREGPLVEGMLMFLATLLSNRHGIGLDEQEVARMEMISLLCMANRTHSQLMEMIPEKCGLSPQAKNFEPILKEVADYKAPKFEAGGSLEQGCYVPKKKMWETDYDPVFVMLRAVHRKDFQASLDRYAEYVHQSGLLPASQPPWPPFRLPKKPLPVYQGLLKLLHNKTFYGMLFTIFYKALNEPSISEAVVYTALYLYEMGLTMATHGRSEPVVEVPKTVFDKSFKDWFPSTNILVSSCQVIHRVAIPLEPVEDVEMELAFTYQNTQHVISLSSGPKLSSNRAKLWKPIVSVSAPNVTAQTSGQPSVKAAVMAANRPQHKSLAGGILKEEGEGDEQEQEMEPEMGCMSAAGQTSYLNTNACDSEMIDMSECETSGAEPATAPSSCPANTSVVDIDENLISLLVKLHNKFSGKAGSYVPGKNVSDPTNRVGDGPYFIGMVLDKLAGLSSECANTIREVCERLVPKSEKRLPQGSKHDNLDKDERKRRAREKQKKLMEQFAAKQKAFMEQAMEDEEESDLSSSSTQESLDCHEEEYDCAICGQSTPSTEERPIGMVVLLQATSVVGHRQQTPQMAALSTADEIRMNKGRLCRDVYEDNMKQLLAEFDETSCLQSLNIGWQGGVNVQSCGHYLHLDCHKSYISSLRNQPPLPSQSLDVSKGEYGCPLCRQLANSILPMAPGAGVAPLAFPLPSGPADMVRHIAGLIQQPVQTSGSSDLTSAIGSMMEGMTNATYAKYRNYSQSHSTENVLLFVCSVARNNLELEILLSDAYNEPQVTKKTCILPLLRVLGMHIKLLASSPITAMWSHLTGVSLARSRAEMAVSLCSKEVPFLLRDPAAILLHLVLSMPPTVERQCFDWIVKCVFNLMYVQSLAVLSCKLPESERSSWKDKGQHSDLDSMEGLLSVVITNLSLTSLYEGIDRESSDLSFCQSVWSPHCVETSIAEYCLSFLKMAAHLLYNMYGNELPVTKGKSESKQLKILAYYLGLCDQPGHGVMNSARCIHWATDMPRALIRTWCREFNSFFSKKFQVGKNLLLCRPTWFPPRFLKLPHTYDEIFRYFRTKKCDSCNSTPKEPAICLVCGTFVCFRGACCKYQESLETVQHSEECGAGTGVFLAVNSSIIVIIQGGRATLWGSLYLDEYGEEDRDLKRGKPLYLSDDRYRLLERQWMTHSFLHCCKRWVLHHGRL